MAKRKNKRRTPNAEITREQLNQEMNLPPEARWVKLRSRRESPVPPPLGLPRYDAWTNEINLSSRVAQEYPAFSNSQYEDVYPYFYTLNYPVYAAETGRTRSEVQEEYALPLVSRGNSESDALLSMTPYLDLYGYDPDPNYTIRFEPVRERATGLLFTDPYTDSSQLMASHPDMLGRYQEMLVNAAPNFSKLASKHEKFTLAMLPTYEMINDDLHSRFQTLEDENRRREEQRLRDLLMMRQYRGRMAEMLQQRGESLGATQTARKDWESVLFRNNNPNSGRNKKKESTKSKSKQRIANALRTPRSLNEEFRLPENTPWGRFTSDYFVGNSFHPVQLDEQIDVVPFPEIARFSSGGNPPRHPPSVRVDVLDSVTDSDRYAPIRQEVAHLLDPNRHLDNETMRLVLAENPLRLNETHADLEILRSLPGIINAEPWYQQSALASRMIDGVRQLIYGQWLQREDQRNFDDDLALIRRSLSIRDFDVLDRLLYEYQAYRTPERDLLIDYINNHARRMGETVEPSCPNAPSRRLYNPKQNNQKRKKRLGKKKK